MINIQPYLTKLDKLKEFINGSIYFNPISIYIDIESIPKLPIDEIIKIWNQTGIISFGKGEEAKPTKITFEEWYQLNKEQ